MLKIELDEVDTQEFETIAKYLNGKHADLGKKKRYQTTKDEPKQLEQMINTITRALAIANK